MPNKIVITKDIPTNSGIRSAVNSYKAGTGYDMPQLSQTSSSIYIPDDVLKNMGLNKSFANYTDEDYNNLYRANDFYAYYNDGLVNGSYTAEDLNNAYQQYLAGKYSTADEINKAAEFGGKYYTYNPESYNQHVIPSVVRNINLNETKNNMKSQESSTTPILTRKQAREQSRQNRGYNRGQFQLAMANAKNALRENSNLRGRDLRQTARRMVAGVGEYAPTPESNIPGTFEEFINQPKYIGAPDQGGSILARRAVQRGADKGIRISPIEEPVPNFGGGLVGSAPQTTTTADLTNVGSFDDAFAMARKNGMKVFTWNGKKYGTNTDPNWRERWGRNKPKVKTSTQKPVASQAPLLSSGEPIAHQKSVDNWNIKDLLSEDFYNELNNSIESGIDEEINTQSNQDIQNIDNYKIDFGPTMEAPNFMWQSENGWENSGANPNTHTWRFGRMPKDSNYKGEGIGFIFEPKPGTVGRRWLSPLDDDLARKYKHAKFYRDDNGYGYILTPDMEHYYGGTPMPIGKTVGYRPANPAIAGSNPKQITGGGALVPTW